VGLDLTLDIHRTIIPELSRLDRPDPYLEARVAAGQLGFKTGAGFRTWSAEQIETLRRRLAQHLLNSRAARLPS
jgi:3-hydroxybutyryl-CoA dehydrogenase